MALPSLFAPSAADQSLVYLYGIFGTVNGVIPTPSGQAAPTMITLLGTMFAKFNTIVLAVAVLVVVYTTVVGIMNTAHEGQFMGKNWNNLWIPIRTVMGIGLLVPSATGYCGIQIVMMWIIVQGVGAADTLWNTALTFYATYGSVYAKVAVPTVEVQNTIRGLFQGLVCAKSAAGTYADPIADDTDIKYFCTKNPNDEFCRRTRSASGNALALFRPAPFENQTDTAFSLGPLSACGTLKTCNYVKSCTAKPDSLGCKACQLQQQTFKEIIPLLAEIANRYVALDYEYMSYWSLTKVVENMPPDKRPRLTPPEFVQKYCADQGDGTCKDLPSPIGNDMNAPGVVIEKMYWDYGLKDIIGADSDQKQKDFIAIMVGKYTGAMDDAVREYVANMNALSKKGLPSMLDYLNNSGWIVAGGSYFIISKGNSQTISQMLPPSGFEVDNDVLPLSKRPLVGYRNNYRVAPILVCLAGGGSSCSGMTNEVMAAPASAAQDGVRMFNDGLEAQGDPLIQMIAQGTMYLRIVEIVFWVFFAVTIALAVIAMVASLQVFGSGMAQGAGPILMQILAVFAPIVGALMSIFLGLGATYAIYVPLIPFTIFTLGAIGWMISVVEAMVAGPLVALGIISPGGQHEMMGKAEPAIGLIFGIFLRPTLMIFGLFAAMLLSAQTVKMANAGFLMITQTTGMAGGLVGDGGFFKVFILMVTQAAFTVAILTKTFSVIYILPERVLSWIGIQLPHEGAGELQEVKGGVEKGAQAADSVGKGAQQGGQAMGGVAEGASKAADRKGDKGGGAKQGGGGGGGGAP